MFEFGLFLILGICVFVPLSERAKLIALVLYVLLMALWLFFGHPINFGAFSAGHA